MAHPIETKFVLGQLDVPSMPKQFFNISSYCMLLTLTVHLFLSSEKRYDDAVLWNGTPHCNPFRMQWFFTLQIWIISQPAAYVLFVYTHIQFEVCLVAKKKSSISSP